MIEIHKKQLDQQLWDVNEKYLKLQQQNRQESIMSSPCEVSTLSQTVSVVRNLNTYICFIIKKNKLL